MTAFKEDIVEGGKQGKQEQKSQIMQESSNPTQNDYLQTYLKYPDEVGLLLIVNYCIRY